MAFINARNDREALSLYEADAAFVPKPTLVLRSKVLIDEVLREFVAMKANLTMHSNKKVNQQMLFGAMIVAAGLIYAKK
ncbi:hypothetical protein ACFL2V_14980 [Pseudomonadota bacterium]